VRLTEKMEIKMPTNCDAAAPVAAMPDSAAHTGGWSIFRTTKLLVRGNDGAVQSEMQVSRYDGFGRNPNQALDDLIEALAEDSDRMADLTPADDEYSIELSCALEDVEGKFEVYRGHHDVRPHDVAPVYSEGAP
jgi:hypothetical protein